MNLRIATLILFLILMWFLKGFLLTAFYESEYQSEKVSDRVNAVQQLFYKDLLGDPPVILLKSLKDKSAKVRRLAVRTLNKAYQGQYVEELKPLLIDSDEEVRFEAVTGLFEIIRLSPFDYLFLEEDSSERIQSLYSEILSKSQK